MPRLLERSAWVATILALGVAVSSFVVAAGAYSTARDANRIANEANDLLAQSIEADEERSAPNIRVRALVVAHQIDATAPPETDFVPRIVVDIDNLTTHRASIESVTVLRSHDQSVFAFPDTGPPAWIDGFDRVEIAFTLPEDCAGSGQLPPDSDLVVSVRLGGGLEPPESIVPYVDLERVCKLAPVE